LTGVHLMRTGMVEANLALLNQDFRLAYLDDLIARKRSGAEYGRLRQALPDAAQASALPETASCKPALDDLLARIRGLGT
jgi:hypothetical protein